MELTAIYRCAAALDIHQAKLTVCILCENEAGEVITELKEFGGFKKDRLAMAAWVASFNPDIVVMESTGIYCLLLGGLKPPASAVCRQGNRPGI